MAWTAPMTAVANTALTAAQWNTHLRDNLLETMPGKATIAGRIFVATGLNAIDEKAVDEEDWTPTLSNLTLGDGTVNASSKLLLGICVWRFILLWGSTTSATAGTTGISTPHTVDVTTGNVIGAGYLDDLTVPSNRKQCVARLSSSTQFQLYYDGGAVNNTGPFTWAVGDRAAVDGAFISTTEF